MNRLAMPLASMVAVLGFLGASTPSEPPDDFQKRGEEIVATVRDRFFDRDKAESWSKAHSRYAERARTEPDFVALTRAALSDLYSVLFTGKARRQVEKLPRDVQERIAARLRDTQVRPSRTTGTATIKQTPPT